MSVSALAGSYNGFGKDVGGGIRTLRGFKSDEETARGDLSAVDSAAVIDPLHRDHLFRR